MGALVPAEKLKGIVNILEEEPGPCFIAVLLFLEGSSFVSAFPAAAM